MVLKVAVQMDPLESINIAGDSSFALMMAAQARGHEIWHYDVASLAYESDGTPQGRITAHAAPVTVQRVQGEHFTAGERRRIDLARDIDVVLMRQDGSEYLQYDEVTVVDADGNSTVHMTDCRTERPEQLPHHVKPFLNHTSSSLDFEPEVTDEGIYGIGEAGITGRE